MARSPNQRNAKPTTLRFGRRGASWRCIALRGPHPDAASRWYWTCRRGPETVWSAWLTAAEAQERFGATVNGASTPESDRSAACLADLLNAWLDQQGVRVRERELWQRHRDEKEAAAGTVESLRGARRPGIARGSLRRYEQACVRLGDMLGPATALAGVGRRLRPAALARLDAGRAATTISSDLDTLAAAWTWGATGGREYTAGLELEIPYVGRERQRERFTPSREQALDVCDHLGRPWMHDVVRVQLEHGCRIEAIADLTAERVDLRRGRLRLVAKGHDRWVPLTEASRAILAPLVAAKGPRERAFDVKSSTIKNSINGEDWRSIAPPSWLRAWARRELGASWQGEWQQEWRLEWLRAWTRAWAHEERADRLAALASLRPSRQERTGEVSRRWARVKGLTLGCMEAGCRRFTTHGIRRRTCTDFIASGMPVHLYAVFAGHSAQVALKHYAATDAGSMERAMGVVVEGWDGAEAR